MAFPCFRTSARFDHGMSGGPIFSQSGQVCGVICSAIKMADSDGTFTSYGSLIAPALALVMRGIDSAGVERDLFLHDFSLGGAVSLDQTGSNLIQNTGDQIVIDMGDGRKFKNRLPSV